MQGDDARINPTPGQRLLRVVLNLYERFEVLVAIVLSILIALIVFVALVELIRIVVFMIENEGLNPLQQDTFQLVFGMIMTLLIALEFKHSILKVALRNDSIVQVRTVILIALLALARKFIILDVHSSPAHIAALAVALLALGVVYGIVRRHDRRKWWRAAPDGDKTRPPAPGPRPEWEKEADNRVR